VCVVYLEKVGGDPMKLVNMEELEKYMTTFGLQAKYTQRKTD